MKLKLHHILIAIILTLLPAKSIFAQGPITAEVDRSALSTDDIVTLTVTVSKADTNAPQLSLPPLDRFNIVGSSSASQINIVNSEISAQFIYRYRLQPLEAGNLIIGPVGVTIDGETFSSESITLDVSEGSVSNPGLLPGQPGSVPAALEGQDFFAVAEVDNSTPYTGEQIVYTFRFYQAMNLLDEPRYLPPTFTGFWSEPLPEQNQYTLQIDNRVYRITELRTILFPTAAGTVTIDEAELTIPGSLRRSGMSLTSQPLTVDVQPLPENAPAGFNGAVGRFAIEAEVSQTESSVNEPITLLVTLDGQGNISALPDPEWPEIPNWRMFESEAGSNTDIQNGLKVGSRIYQQLLVPETAGEHTIPPITYTYFDPFNGEYRTISTAPIDITIAPGQEVPPVSPVVIAGSRDGIERLATDIRHIKPAPSELKSAAPPLTSRWFYWLVWLIPLFVLGGNFYWQWQQTYLRRNAGLTRKMRAQKKAKKSLAQARKTQQDPYQAGGQILRAYLSDKLNRPVTGLTQNDLAEQLKAQNLDSSRIKRVQNSLSLSDMGRFSPAAANPTRAARFLNEVGQLVDDLEESFEKQ